MHLLYNSTGITQTDPTECANTRGGLKVFDFHPIHVFLNTETLECYERTQTSHHSPNELIKHRCQGYGTRSRLIELLRLVT